MQRCMGCMREFGKEYDVCPYCGYIVDTDVASKKYLAPGTVLQNRYTLGKVLGQGGFGITYIAWDNKIGRAVAIKEYMPNAFASRITGEVDVSCFNEEAQRYFDLGLEKTREETHALSQFGALESVVKVYDCVEENKTAYIVMELLRGKTVKEILEERGKLTFAETMRIMTPVLQTLDAMHQVGMIHRDVAPDNIFVCEDGKIKLLDFGAARVVSETDEKTLSITLKVGYAPVEQYCSKSKQGSFTDVYAASAAIYKMLTGKTPPNSLSRTMNSDDLQDELSKSDAPQNAQKTILHGMAVNAADRIQSVTELLETLQKDSPENVAGIDPKRFLREQKKKQTKKIARIAIAAALVVCIVIGVVTISKPKNRENDEPGERAASFSDPAEESAKSFPVTSEPTAAELSTTEPESDTAQNDTQWIAVYKNYLLERIKQDKAEADNPDASDDYNPRSFSLIYLDGDAIPELVVSEESFHAGKATVITFFNGKLQSFSGLGAYGTFQYKEREGIIVEEDAHSGVSGATAWHFAQGSLKCVWSGYEMHPELMYEDGGEPKYYVQDANALETSRKTESDSDYEKLHASEKEISEAEYKAEYNQYIPAGMSEAIRECGLSPSMTQKNVNLYFNALTKKDSVPLITNGYDKITFSGTVSERKTNYYGSDYYELQLDQPIVVQFKDDTFPALLADIRISSYDNDHITIGHTTVQGHPEKESDGCVWLEWIA